jgi:hypothetical protein
MEVAYAEVNIETVFQPIMFSGKCHAFSASGLYCKGTSEKPRVLSGLR